MKNITKRELIGSDVVIQEARNKSLCGIKGTIIDETKNTFTIRTEGGTKRIIKDQVVVETEGIRIDGELLVGKPEDRIKRRLPK